MIFRQKNKLGLDTYRHLDQQDYKDLVSKANAHSDSVVTQYRHLKNIGTSKKLLLQFLADQAQYKMVEIPRDITFEFTAAELEWMLRSIKDLVNHLQEDLPDGVYEYNFNRIEDFLYKCLAGAERKKWERLRRET
ncbi:hypothetical protein H1164_17980 [Thermoactinomyces daqus]|uniref:Uncharacterized protein n=1 Tax=Thermoactinomyces daqus TaxID=1329516 RepID=A0A7W1XDJ0_9BACL|nr:hypothetical protein [Thermoactinomyces daqus]MBA4544701.1 hypothetical protein [Thermoactinomyces daqus]